MQGPNFEDDIETNSCDYVKAVNTLQWKNETYGDLTVFKDIMYLRDDLRDKYAVIMDLNSTMKENMTFNQAYHYADLVFSQQFEGIQSKKVNWTEDKDSILYVNRT
jgi:hypothetical protein